MILVVLISDDKSSRRAPDISVRATFKGTLTTPAPGGNKTFLQFPGMVESFVDTRLLEPTSVTSNVVALDGHGAEYTLDDSPHHYWSAAAATKASVGVQGRKNFSNVVLYDTVKREFSIRQEQYRPP